MKYFKIVKDGHFYVAILPTLKVSGYCTSKLGSVLDLLYNLKIYIEDQLNKRKK